MINKILSLLFLVFIFITESFCVNIMNTMHLMPVPAEVVSKQGKFRIDSTFCINIAGVKNKRIENGCFRILTKLAGRTGLFLKNPLPLYDVNNTTWGMHIKYSHPGKLFLGEDESYVLRITANKIELSAKTDLGVLHGLETFLQLLDTDNDGYFVPVVLINDAPRFQWRGLMIDASRHFMPVEVIKRNLDGMAMVKMNVFHWHLSDDQGFRVECKTFPKLYESGSDGFYYTQEQIKDVINYAADRGIRVIPEFDLPGHATAWFVGYPQLASAPGPYVIEREWGIFDPVFNPVNEETYKFLDAFFGEMAELFPDEYMHIGGDENNGKHWDKNPDIQDYMRKNHISDNHTLQSYFNKRLLKILSKYDKKMVGWEEILHPDMPKNIVIQSWQGEKSLIEAASKGYNCILSNGYYIDLIQPTDFHYLTDPSTSEMPLTDQQRKHILGGEATMWSEFVSPETIDSRIWPRTAAIAERLWSPFEVNDVDDMYLRLDRISYYLEELGLQHEKNYQIMLKRLSNNTDYTALKNFIDIIEPVKIYRRNDLRPQTSFTPLTRVVDAARPDQKKARDFRKLVDLFLTAKAEDQNMVNEIRFNLVSWRDNHRELLKMIQISPILNEIELLSADLSRCAIIGLEALKMIESGSKSNEEWRENSLRVLKNAGNPRGQCELMVIDAIEKLLLYSD